MSTEKQRSRRFKRKPLEQRVQLTERDLNIIRAVYKHRFLRSAHIIALCGGSAQQVLRRLRLLYDAGYLDRPREQLSRYTAGNKPFVYALGNKGADVLREEDGVARGKFDWTSKNREVKQQFLEHTLDVAEVMVAFELACRKEGTVRLIEPLEVLARASEAVKREKNPFGWRTRVSLGGHQQNLGVYPDTIFGLQFLEEEEGKNSAYFFLEVDRATMPVVRNNLNQTSFYRKLLAYHASIKEGVHRERYGMKGVRVMTVTTSPARIESLIEASKRANEELGLRVSGGYFLFAEKKQVTPETVLEMPWLTGKGQTAHL